ncbi:hypothetical protein FHR71_001756 [Methylobacterium sp. RAS18]|nr:hypothetical protein [Methylobacterium sp. RAS18]
MPAVSDMSQDGLSRFRALWDGGYRRLVPIVPPDAELSPHSSLARRPGCRGKAVGVKGQHGWHGFNWHVHETTEADLDRWAAMGAGVGLRMGEGLIAIDIDALDPQLAAAAAQAAFEILGVAPRRFGRAPKLLLLYRCAVDLPYERIEFDGLDGKVERVEALGPGQQAVLFGVHPGTGRSYLWPDGLPDFEDLPEITAEQKQAYFDRLVEIMPNGRRPSAPNSVDRAQVDQQSLAAPASAVRKAVEAIPNDRSDRAWNIRMAAAIKAAVPDDPDEAFDIYWSWCQRWTVRDKEYDHAWSDFQSIGERRGIGAPYLFALASSETNEVMTPPELFFAPIADGEEPDTSAFRAITMVQTFQLGLPAGVEPITAPPNARSIPVRSYLLEPRLSPGTVTEYVGEPGVSKSTMTIWDAIVVASGDETVLRGEGGLSPERLHQTGPVIIYNAEDSQAEMLRRLTAAMSLYGIRELKHPIHLWSGLDDGPIVIVKRERANGAVMRAEGANQLARAIQSTGAVYVALDPLAKLASGTSENDTDDMNALTQELARDAARLGVSIALVHHTAKHTRNLAGDMGAGRGAFSIAGGVRSVWTLCNVAPDEAKAWGLSERDYIRLDHAKANHGRKLDMPILLKRENAAVGNGRGDDTPAAHRSLFDLSVREALELEGDRAPVLRVVGVGRPTEAMKVERRAESNNLVIQTVLGAIDGVGEIPLSTVREPVTRALREAGLLGGAGREALMKCLQSALGGEAQTGVLDGQSVRLRLRKDGLSTTAPWVLLVDKASPIADDTALSALSISEADKAYKTVNTSVFD